jgi:hypothetical protein
MVKVVWFLSYATVALAGLNGTLERLRKRAITTEDYFAAVDAAEPVELTLETRSRRERAAP